MSSHAVTVNGSDGEEVKGEMRPTSALSHTRQTTGPRRGAHLQDGPTDRYPAETIAKLVVQIGIHIGLGCAWSLSVLLDQG